MRVRSARTGRPTSRHDCRPLWSPRWLASPLLALTMVLAGGCFGGSKTAGNKPAAETKPPPDSPAALRQDVDRLRADVAELRTKMEAAQRVGAEHADRVAQETRSEFDAVRNAMEATARNDLQRQVEVLDAQARRVDLLEKRANDMGQTLRRIEMSLVGLESQLSRLLDARSPGAGTRGATPARTAAAPAPSRPAEESAPPASASDAAAGAGLTPPAMLGPARGSKSASAPPAPASTGPAQEAKVVPPTGTPPDDASATTKRSDPPRVAKTTGPAQEAKVAPPTGTPPDDASATGKRTDPPRVAKTTGPAQEAKVVPPTGTPPDDASATGKRTDPPRVAKTTPPSVDPKAAVSPPSSKSSTSAGPAPAGSLGARALFDRGMESWNKGEQGQAVLDFEELIQKFPTDPLAASAQFRIGEAYYAARDFERAALEYRKAVDLAPKGRDTPQALLRLGLAYRAQKREADARQAWNQLVRDFPDSDATEEARRALRGR